MITEIVGNIKNNKARGTLQYHHRRTSEWKSNKEPYLRAGLYKWDDNNCEIQG